MPNVQLQLGVALPAGLPSLHLAKASVMLAAGPSSCVSVLSSQGLALVADLPEGISCVGDAVMAQSLPYELSQKISDFLAADGVGSALVHAEDVGWISTQLTRLHDQEVLSDLVSRALGWDYLVQNRLLSLGHATSPQTLLNRLSYLGTLLVGAHAFNAPGDLDEETLTELALGSTDPGEWTLLSRVAAASILSYGFSAVFTQGEKIDLDLTIQATQAVNLGLLALRADELGLGLGQLAAKTARKGIQAAL